MTKEEIRKIELEIKARTLPLFNSGTKIHTKWFGLKNDVLTQYGTLEALINSSSTQILYEAYEDHVKKPTIIVFFFDGSFKELPCLSFSTGWKLGKRISTATSDKNFEVTDPLNNLQVLELGTNLYSKAYSSTISKIIKLKSYADIGTLPGLASKKR